MTDSTKEQEPELIRSATRGSLRPLILELWQQTRMDWGFVTDRLASTFRRERTLGSKERRFVAEFLYALVRHVRRIDLALVAGGYKSVGRAPDEKRLIACLVLEYGFPPQEATRLDDEVDWRAVQGINEKLEGISRAPERIALRHSLPDFLAQWLVDDRGVEGAEALAKALNERAPMTLRANTLRSLPEDLIRELSQEGIDAVRGQYAPFAVQLVTRTNAFSLEAFKKGLFEVQDEGSQLLADLVAPPPKGIVIDYCAGAGGKTLALAAALNNRGRIYACDIDSRKLKELRKRTKRAGVGNTQVVTLSPEGNAAFPKPLEPCIGKAARVLVDAPCSGVGALRRNPEARWRLSEADVKRLVGTQHDIIRRGLELVKPGGRLIYATCSVLRRENEEIVERLLAERSDLEIVSPREVWGAKRGEGLQDATGRFLDIGPDRHGTDGFFAAVIRPKTTS